MVKKKYLKRSDSRETLRFYTPNKDVATVYPEFSYQAIINMINNDPVARGAVNHFVDKCMEGNYNLVTKKDKKLDTEFGQLLENEYNFRTHVLRPIFLLGKLFNNVFIELVKKVEGDTKQINVLDTLNIDAITKPNGDPIKYVAKTPSKLTGKYPEWTDDEVTWIKFNDRRIGYAPIDLRALWENLLAKNYIKEFVAWLWKTGQYRVIYNFKSGARQQAIEDFLAFAKRNDHDFRVPFPIQGDLEMMMARDMNETSSIVELLKYYDNQTLILLRVPPVDAGVPDASGRSNADAQSNNLDTHIISMKKIVEDYISNDLFKKMKKEDKQLVFGPHDRFAEKQVFEDIQILSSINLTDEAIEEFLNTRGVYFKSKLFKEPEDMMLPMMGGTDENNNPQNPRDKDNQPSRIGKGTGEANKNQDKPTTREDQIKKV